MQRAHALVLFPQRLGADVFAEDEENSVILYVVSIDCAWRPYVAPVALLNALLYLDGALEAPPACALLDTNDPREVSASAAALAIRALDMNSSVGRNFFGLNAASENYDPLDSERQSNSCCRILMLTKSA